MRSESKLIFFHIPKTAGTTFHEFLERSLGAQNCTDLLKHAKLTEAVRQYSTFHLISGHIFPSIGDRLPEDRHAIVILRDPIDRILSSAYYSRDVSAAPTREMHLSAAPSLDEVVAKILATSDNELNLQTQILFPLGTEQSSVLLGSSGRMKGAKMAIDAIHMVGIQSEIEDFRVMVSRRMGWSISGELAHLNVTSKRPRSEEINAEDRRRILARLAPDIELFEYAKSRFVQDRRRMIAVGDVLAGSTNVSSMRVTAIGEHSTAEHVVFPTHQGEGLESGDRSIEIRNVMTVGELSRTEQVLTGEPVTISITFFANAEVDGLTIGFSIRDKQDVCIFGTNTRLCGHVYSVSRGLYNAVFKFLNRLNEGIYYLDVDLHRGLSTHDGHFHSKRRAARIEVVGNHGVHFDGRFRLDVDASVCALGADAILGHGVSAEADLPTYHVARMNPALQEFSCKLRQIGAINEIEANGGAVISMEVSNTSNVEWRSSGMRHVALSYHWQAEDGSMVVFDGLRTRLPYDLDPGDSVTVRAFLRAPNASGKMQLVWDLVQEEIGWFGEQDPQSRHMIWIEVSK